MVTGEVMARDVLRARKIIPCWHFGEYDGGVVYFRPFGVSTITVEIYYVLFLLVPVFRELFSEGLFLVVDCFFCPGYFYGSSSLSPYIHLVCRWRKVLLWSSGMLLSPCLYSSRNSPLCLSRM